jgi:hypothetical protein
MVNIVSSKKNLEFSGNGFRVLVFFRDSLIGGGVCAILKIINDEFDVISETLLEYDVGNIGSSLFKDEVVRKAKGVCGDGSLDDVGGVQFILDAYAAYEKNFESCLYDTMSGVNCDSIFVSAVAQYAEGQALYFSRLIRQLSNSERLNLFCCVDGSGGGLSLRSLEVRRALFRFVDFDCAELKEAYASLISAFRAESAR